MVIIIFLLVLLFFRSNYVCTNHVEELIVLTSVPVWRFIMK